MPRISNFYGIVINMFFIQKEHNPPHIHAVYGEYLGEFDIRNSELLEGDLPKKAVAMVQEWIGLHRSELLEIWNTQNFKEIEGLE
ncbi:hypothetical protein FACS1894125_1590 [Actinomycetota bacterium]|nr:hypothetical protein FACS1894125_1590 [Actinomycetota bacterium]